jgi:hypothetical protein
MVLVPQGEAADASQSGRIDEIQWDFPPDRESKSSAGMTLDQRRPNV